MSFIEVKDCSKIYHSGDTKVQALVDASLNIEKGEFLALMGPSGSGKSTLLSILGALNPPTSGTIVVDDISIYDLSTERRSDFRSSYIGFVFQQFHLVPYLTAEENVMLPQAILRYSHREQLGRAHEALDRVGLKEKNKRLPNELSGGEQERVAIARAIVNRPPIVYADEPTGALDTATSEEIMRLFSDLNQDGLTIVMVTHNQETTKYVGRIIYLRDGKIKHQEQQVAAKQVASK